MPSAKIRVPAILVSPLWRLQIADASPAQGSADAQRRLFVRVAPRTCLRQKAVFTSSEPFRIQAFHIPMTITHSAPAIAQTANFDDRWAVRCWLIAVAGLVFLMVLVGGATRLTKSGLSITQWKPVTGILPPLSGMEWQAEFDRYKQIPQFAELNSDMNLDGFKAIFWWEWAHRLLARVVGAAFILPALWFWWRGQLKGALGRQVAVATGLLALEPIVGWWMVSSGLSERTEVAQERLALHLLIAAATFGALIYAAVGLSEWPRLKTAPRGFAISAWIFAALVFCQLGLGALVAGLRAGLIYNTWPLMGSGLIPGEAFRPDPLQADIRRCGDGAIRPPGDRLRRRRLRDCSGDRCAARRAWLAACEPRIRPGGRRSAPGRARHRDAARLSFRSSLRCLIRRWRSPSSAFRSSTCARLSWSKQTGPLSNGV